MVEVCPSLIISLGWTIQCSTMGIIDVLSNMGIIDVLKYIMQKTEEQDIFLSNGWLSRLGSSTRCWLNKKRCPSSNSERKSGRIPKNRWGQVGSPKNHQEKWWYSSIQFKHFPSMMLFFAANDNNHLIYIEIFPTIHYQPSRCTNEFLINPLGLYLGKLQYFAKLNCWAIWG